MEFVQIVEFSSTKIDEIRKLSEQLEVESGTQPGGPESTVAITADRDTPDRYLVIAQFPSYEAAMENSNRPEVSAFAQAMAELCDGPPTFRNLDVVDRRQG